SRPAARRSCRYLSLPSLFLLWCLFFTGFLFGPWCRLGHCRVGSRSLRTDLLAGRCFVRSLRCLFGGRSLRLLGRRLLGSLGLRGFLRLLSSLRLALLFQLLDAGVDHVHQVAERGGEQSDDRHQRSAHRTHELAVEHVCRRKRREARDVGLPDLLAFQDSSADLEDARLPHRGVQRLRDGDWIAVRLEKRDRRWAVQEGQERIGPGLLGRTPRERVLDDREAGPVVEELAAQLVDRRHGEPAVVGDDQRLGGAELIGELGYHLFFVGSQHRITSSNESGPPARGAEQRQGRASFLGRASAGLLRVLRRQLSLATGVSYAVTGSACSSSSSTIPLVRAGSTWM